MLQSLSHLGTLPSVMCSVSHPPARLEVLLASLWRQGWRAGGTSWVLSATLLYELFQGFIQADLKNEIPQAFPQRFAISRAFQTLRAAMPKVATLLPSLDVFTASFGQFPVWQQDLFVEWLFVSSAYLSHSLLRIFIESNLTMSAFAVWVG